MDKFTLATFSDIHASMDIKNKVDDKTFYEGMKLRLKCLTNNNIQEIRYYLYERCSVNNDFDISQLTLGQIEDLSSFINVSLSCNNNSE